MAPKKDNTLIMFGNIYEKFIRIHPREPESNWCKWFKVCPEEPNKPRGLAIPLKRSDYNKVILIDEFNEKIFVELTMKFIGAIKGNVIKAGQVKLFLTAVAG